MLSMGNVMVITLKVKNNTNTLIKKINFLYDSQVGKTTLKNIKSKHDKQTGIPTIKSINNLRMIIEDGDKTYLIKEHIPRGDRNKLIITIDDLNDGVLTYKVEISDY